MSGRKSGKKGCTTQQKKMKFTFVMQIWVNVWLKVTRFKGNVYVFEIEEWRAVKNWAKFYKKRVQELILSKIVNTKNCSSNSIFSQEVYMPQKNLNFTYGFKSAILAEWKNCQNGTFAPVHEIQKLFWPKDFFWGIMKEEGALFWYS